MERPTDEETAALEEVVAHRSPEEGHATLRRDTRGGASVGPEAEGEADHGQGLDWFPWEGRGEVEKQAWDWQESVIPAGSGDRAVPVVWHLDSVLRAGEGGRECESPQQRWDVSSGLLV